MTSILYTPILKIEVNNSFFKPIGFDLLSRNIQIKVNTAFLFNFLFLEIRVNTRMSRNHFINNKYIDSNIQLDCVQ